MTIKHKFKPAAKSEIREKVELKFRARGAVAFHLLLVLVGAVLLIYNFSYLWASRYFDTAYLNSILAFVVLAASGALHYIRYHFRHGKGRDQSRGRNRGADQARAGTGGARRCRRTRSLDSLAARRQAKKPPPCLAASDSVRQHHQFAISAAA